MTAPLRIGLVGAGSMGSLHARVISASDRAELVAVVEPRQEAGDAISERYGVPRVDDLDAAGPLDAVVVAAATEAHYPIGVQVLERGLPLLMEKPLADRLADAVKLVDLSRERDVPLMCGLLERFNPAILTTMQLLEAPLHITAQRHSPYVARIRTGVASDLLIHDVDIVVRMMGSSPTSVSGSLGYLNPESAPGAEDVAEAVMGFEGGAIANVSASRLSQRKVRGFVVAEIDRLIEVDMLRNDVTIYRHVLNESDPSGLSYRQQSIIEIPALVTTREPLAAQLDRFVDLATGVADAEEERSAILPGHEVVEHVRNTATA